MLVKPEEKITTALFYYWMRISNGTYDSPFHHNHTGTTDTLETQEEPQGKEVSKNLRLQPEALHIPQHPKNANVTAMGKGSYLNYVYLNKKEQRQQ